MICLKEPICFLYTLYKDEEFNFDNLDSYSSFKFFNYDFINDIMLKFLIGSRKKYLIDKETNKIDKTLPHYELKKEDVLRLINLKKQHVKNVMEKTYEEIDNLNYEQIVKFDDIELSEQLQEISILAKTFKTFNFNQKKLYMAFLEI